MVTYKVYKEGEKPGKARYQCTACKKVIELDDDTDALPPCPSCAKGDWWKLAPKK